jgi:hypothetical protein
MLIAFLTNDLVFPSRVAGIAQSIGARMETASNVAGLIAKITTAAAEPVVVLIDLASSNVAPADIVPILKSLNTPPHSIIAFGPHVHQQQLDAAKSAGCDMVLTRGQFDSQMATLLAGFSAIN